LVLSARNILEQSSALTLTLLYLENDERREDNIPPPLTGSTIGPGKPLNGVGAVSIIFIQSCGVPLVPLSSIVALPLLA